MGDIIYIFNYYNIRHRVVRLGSRTELYLYGSYLTSCRGIERARKLNQKWDPLVDYILDYKMYEEENK